MKTGQASIHAPHVVHCHRRSGDAAETVLTIGAANAEAPSFPPFLRLWAKFRRSMTRSRGESDLPAAFAGQTETQRPHSVQASRSSRSFHVNPVSVLTPIGSPVSASLSKSSSFSDAPLGASRAV